MTRIAPVILAAALVLVPVHHALAGQDAPPAPPAPPAAPAAPAAPASPAPPAPPEPPAPAERTRNIQFDLVITDTREGKPERKTVSMLVRDGSRSSIRANSSVPVRLAAEAIPPINAFQFSSVSLSLDAGGEILSDAYVAINAVFELTTVDSDAPEAPSTLSQHIDVTIQNGETVLVSRSADPMTDRTVTVELTATIVEP